MLRTTSSLIQMHTKYVPCAVTYCSFSAVYRRGPCSSKNVTCDLLKQRTVGGGALGIADGVGGWADSGVSPAGMTWFSIILTCNTHTQPGLNLKNGQVIQMLLERTAAHTI